MTYILFFSDGGTTSIEAPSFYDAACSAELAGEPEVVGYVETQHLREVAAGLAEYVSILDPDISGGL